MPIRRRVDDDAHGLAAQAVGEAQVALHRGDHLVEVQLAVLVQLRVEEHVVALRVGAVLLERSEEAVDLGLRHVREVREGLFADDFDAARAQAGRVGDAIVEVHLAQESLVLVGVQRHAALDAVCWVHAGPYGVKNG
jgi:hypothetical protein